MPSSTSSSSPAVLALSLVLPVLLLGLGFADTWLSDPAFESPIPAHMNREMDQRRPELVLVGNSELHFGVDADLLEQQLGVPTVSLACSGSSTPYWYAVLENRVYARGHRPKIVIVMGDLPRFVETRSAMTDAAALFEQLGENEPVLARKVFGSESGSIAAARWRASRIEKRDAIIEPWKDGLVGLLWGEGRLEERIARGPALAEAAGREVFDPATAVDLELRTRVIPVAESTGAQSNGISFDESLIPDLAALAEANGSTLVFLRAPLRGDNPARHPSPDDEAQFDALLRELGIRQISGTGRGFDDEDFTDMWHLRADKKGEYTRELAEAIRSLGVLEAAGVTGNSTGEGPSK